LLIQNELSEYFALTAPKKFLLFIFPSFPCFRQRVEKLPNDLRVIVLIDHGLSMRRKHEMIGKFKKK
jgi:hypothetical protein